MAQNSKIEWTDHTFNPWVGCTKISPGCDHCYAESWAKRSGSVVWGGARRRTTTGYWRGPLKWNQQCEKAGIRQRVFCASLADVFDTRVPNEWRMDLFNLIHATPHLDWLLLTKRIGNVQALCQRDSLMFELMLTRVWLGSTVVNQEEADRDLPKLLAVPARLRFLSCEPLLGPINIGSALERYELPWPGGSTQTLDWVIAGGESGPGARPMNPLWLRMLRDDCASARTPFFFKQWGEWSPDGVPPVSDSHRWPIAPAEPEGGTWSYRIGKHRAGALLDGREHREFPA